MKAYYQPEELTETWNEMIAPSLREEVIDYFEQMDFANYASLCENCKDQTLRFSYSLGNQVLRYLAMAYNCLWTGDYEKGGELLKSTISDAPDSDRPEYQEYNMDISNGKEVLAILEKRASGWEEAVREKLRRMEKDALEKSWGIAVDENGDTVKKSK